MLSSIKTLCLGLCTAALCTLPPAVADVGGKPPAPQPAVEVDKSPRCLPATVNECRAACMSKKIDLSDKVEIARKQNECRQNCIRGC